MEGKQLSFFEDIPAKTIVILISGKAGSGKSTVAELLRQKLAFKRYSVTRKSFADKVKECARKYMLWDGKKDERGRRLLQRIGTDVGREYDPDIWVKLLLEEIHSFMFPPDFVIIDDARFPNELELTSKDESFQCVKIRVEAPQLVELKGESASHPSETSLDDYNSFDITIWNTGTIKELENHIDQIIERNILP